MFKLIKNSILACCFAMLCTMPLSPSANAATNPAGTTINTMEVTATDPVLENHGTILNGALYSVAGDYRIAMYGNSSGTASYNFSNFGDITINDAQAHSYGMFAKSATGSHTLTNNGTINIISIDKLAHGMYAHSTNGSHTLINNGTILLRSSDRHAELLIAMYIYTDVVGGSHTLINNGTIIINAYKASYGMYSSNSANLHNSGYISVRGTGQEIFGMRGESAGLTISNTGVIDVWADEGIASEALAHEGNLNVGTWATTLRKYSIKDNVFGIYKLGQVNFNNSTLILRPGTSAQGFQLGKTYNVADMIKFTNNMQDEGTLANAHVDGNIAEAVAEVPFLKATLVNGNDPFNATVRLDSNISEETTPGFATMQQAVSQLQSQFNNLSEALRNSLVQIYTQANLVADAGQNNASGVAAGSNTVNNKWQIFLSPNANYINNSKYDYDGSNMGVTAGASYRMSEQFSFGAHLDLSFGDYSGELLNMSTDSTSFALGLHAAYNFTPEWYLRGQVTGAIYQNDSYFKTASLNGDSNNNGEALYAELATGYTWQIAKGHTITPEIGVSYLVVHTNPYVMEWSMAGTPMPLYDMNYDDSYYNALYATAHIDWRGEWELENNSSIALLAGLGLRQALTDGEMETNFRAFVSKFNTKTTEDLTTFLADVGVEYKKDNLSISLNYIGGFGYHQYSHGGNLMFKFEF